MCAGGVEEGNDHDRRRRARRLREAASFFILLLAEQMAMLVKAKSNTRDCCARVSKDGVCINVWPYACDEHRAHVCNTVCQF